MVAVKILWIILEVFAIVTGTEKLFTIPLEKTIGKTTGSEV